MYIYKCFLYLHTNIQGALRKELFKQIYTHFCCYKVVSSMAKSLKPQGNYKVSDLNKTHKKKHSQKGVIQFFFVQFNPKDKFLWIWRIGGENFMIYFASDVDPDLLYPDPGSHPVFPFIFNFTNLFFDAP